MSERLADFNGLELFFLACAVIGGFFVLVKLVLQFMGGDSDLDSAADPDFGIDADHTNSDAGFRVLSLHGLAHGVGRRSCNDLTNVRHRHHGAPEVIATEEVIDLVRRGIAGRLVKPGWLRRQFLSRQPHDRGFWRHPYTVALWPAHEHIARVQQRHLGVGRMHGANSFIRFVGPVLLEDLPTGPLCIHEFSNPYLVIGKQ